MLAKGTSLRWFILCFLTVCVCGQDVKHQGNEDDYLDPLQNIVNIMNVEEENCPDDPCKDNEICREEDGGKKICVCKEGYERNGEECEKCDCGVNSDKCEFKSGKIQCTCQEGFSQIGNTCKENCPGDPCKKDNEICGKGDDGNKICVCKEGYERNDKECEKCDCGVNSDKCEFKSGKIQCTCQEGFSQKGNTCKECQCGANSKKCEFGEDGNVKCTCNEGYLQKNGKCEECQCGENSKKCEFGEDGNVKCTCNKGYLQKNGKCEACDCGKNSVKCEFKGESIKCTCKDGFSQDQNTCKVNCPDNPCKKPNEVCGKNEKGETTCVCKKGYERNDENCEECDCGKNSTKCEFETGIIKCTCKEGFAQNKKICQAPCKANKDCFHEGVCKIRHGENKFCSCEEGFSGDKCEIIDGCKKFEPQCSKSGGICKYHLEEEKVYCDCQDKDYDPRSKECKECDCGEQSKGCKFDLSGKICDCQEGYSQRGDKCGECNCGNGSIGCSFDDTGNKKCQCENGFSQKGDSCAKCDCGESSTGCSFDDKGNKLCECNTGYAQKGERCAETCGNDNDCKFNGTCKDEAGKKFCVCKKDLSGDKCENIEGCKKLEKTCKRIGGVCTYDIEEEKAVCQCTEEQKFDEEEQKCRGTCTEDKECLYKGNCTEDEEGDKFCRCENGLGGDKCEVIVGCNDTKSECEKTEGKCIYDLEKKEGRCECPIKKLFNPKSRACEACECGPQGINCVFDSDGAKICICATGYAQKGEQCAVCDCGPKGTSCGFPQGSKTCTCEHGFAQKGETCEACDCGVNSEKCEFETSGNVKCTCKDGFAQKDNVCQEKCPENPCDKYEECVSHEKEKKCVCKENYKRNGKTGKCQVCDCGGNSKNCSFNDNGEKICVCNSGYVPYKGKCKECNCGEKAKNCSFNDNGKKNCVCDNGYVVKKDKCTATCDDDHECEYGGECKKEGEHKFCKCKEDLKGDKCEIVDCETKYPGCKKSGGECEYDEEKLAYCECTSDKLYNREEKKCQEYCDANSECHGGQCIEKFCKCKEGRIGDKCADIKDCQKDGVLKDCESSGGTCIYEEDTEKAKCVCEEGKDFDDNRKMCRKKCEGDKDCKHEAKCTNGFCSCPPGTKGDYCQDVEACAEGKELRKECDDAKADCVYDGQSGGKCVCKDSNYAYDKKEKKCFAKWCETGVCGSDADCKFDDALKTGYCICKDSQYFDYSTTKCKAVDKCLLRKIACKENERCDSDGKCKCAFGEDKDKKCKKRTYCTTSKCFTGSSCEETDIPEVVRCICKEEGQFYNGQKCVDGSCFLKGKTYCKNLCPVGMKNTKEGDCEAKEEKRKCNKDCGKYGWCLKDGDKEKCQCMKGFAKLGKEGDCVPNPSIVCASGILTNDEKKCNCTETFKYAANGITCERKSCADSDVQKECQSQGATKCVDNWRAALPKTKPLYSCSCASGYEMDTVTKQCKDFCSLEKYKETCWGEDKICYNSIGSDSKPTVTCVCPPSLYSKNKNKCDDADKNSYMLHNLPVLKKKYFVKGKVDQVLLNADIINAMKVMYQNLDYAFLYNLTSSEEVLNCTVWLRFKTDSTADIKRINRQTLTKFKCDDCIEEGAVLPPSLFLSPQHVKYADSEKIAFCSDAVTNTLCGKGAVCKDNKCSCSQGYRISEYSQRKISSFTVLRCEDINECTEGIHTCSKNTTCVNTLGSYFCKCKQGFKKSTESLPYKNEENKEDCVDLCTPNPCKNGKCTMKDGVFDCSCPVEYKGSLCHIPDPSIAAANKKTVVVGAVLGTLLALVVVAFGFYYWRLRKNAYSEDFTPAPRPADNAEMMERRPIRGVTNRGYQ